MELSAHQDDDEEPDAAKNEKEEGNDEDDNDVAAVGKDPLKQQNSDKLKEEKLLETDDDAAGTAMSCGTKFTERLLQFDIRANCMKEDWYLQFSDVRTGSFSLRRSTGGSDKLSEHEWETKQKGNKCGRQKDGAWGQRTSVTIRFLHWVGFKPRLLLPTPNEDTAQTWHSLDTIF